MSSSWSSTSEYSLPYSATEVDGGFAVEPKRNCPHVLLSDKHIAAISTANEDELKRLCLAAAQQTKCQHPSCDEKDENWLCLQCGVLLCSRYKNAHMADHCDQDQEDESATDHCIAVSMSDLSFWCYKCESYIQSPVLRQVNSLLYAARESIGKEPVFNNRVNKASAAQLEEHFDNDVTVEKAAKFIASKIARSGHLVVYTGAGISTSAKIPDYRGPKGIWTLRDQGRSHECNGIEIEQAHPTYAHYALTLLAKKGIVKRIVTTNVDGLHRRSGCPRERLSELHGSCYREMCEKCDTEYLRGFDVTKTVVNHSNHLTGRLCTVPNCGGRLKDSIIHFTENLPESELNPSLDDSSKADVTIVLGTSMQVKPACNLPMMNRHAQMFIVNLQQTPYDESAIIKLYARTDQFMKLVMQELQLHDEVDETYDELQK